jgi:hypothetical protein
VTENQQYEAMGSLGTEFTRVAHAIDVAADDVVDRALDLALIIQYLGDGKICANNLNGLAKLVLCLRDIGDHHTTKQRETN